MHCLPIFAYKMFEKLKFINLSINSIWPIGSSDSRQEGIAIHSAYQKKSYAFQTSVKIAFQNILMIFFSMPIDAQY